MLQGRPKPPEELTDELRLARRFVPSPELKEWAFGTFVLPGGSLRNPEHAHLEFAHVDFLWTSVENTRGGRQIVGMAEIPDQGSGGKWAKARARQQLGEWFGGVPDFLVTIDAVHADAIDDATFCALVEHELYHCGQQLDEYGAPKFKRDGSPVFAIRGHDVEEFVGVVRRYGVGASAGGVAELVEAANECTEVTPAGISAACGTCTGRVRGR